MDLTFNFNGIDSSAFGIIGSFKVPPLPPKRRSTITVPGMDGVVDFGGDSFEPLIITGECSIKAASRAARDAALSSAAVWLSGAGPLILGRDRTKQWPKAKVYGQLDLDPIGKNGMFQLVFECTSPYLEDIAETTVVELTADTDYGSPIKFNPTIEITMTGAASALQVSLLSTGEYMLLSDSLVENDVIVFDMARGRVTKNGQDSRNKLLTGSYPFGILPGIQTITVNTTGTYTVSMTYHKRYLYA